MTNKHADSQANRYKDIHTVKKTNKFTYRHTDKIIRSYTHVRIHTYILKNPRSYVHNSFVTTVNSNSNFSKYNSTYHSQIIPDCHMDET